MPLELPVPIPEPMPDPPTLDPPPRLPVVPMEEPVPIEEPVPTDPLLLRVACAKAELIQANMATAVQPAMIVRAEPVRILSLLMLVLFPRLELGKRGSRFTQYIGSYRRTSSKIGFSGF